MTEKWYVARGGEQHGPYSIAHLQQFAEQGRLVPTDMLLKEGEPKWVSATTVEGLFGAQTVTPPAPLPTGSAEGDKAAAPFSVPDIRQLAASGSASPALIGVAAALASPLGLYFVWQHPRWTVKEKWIWTGAAAAVLLLGLFLIPRIVLALVLLSGCALVIDWVWTHSDLTLDQKRMWMSISGFVSIIGLTIVLLTGQGFDGGGSSGGSSGANTSSKAYQAGYKVGYEHGVEVADVYATRGLGADDSEIASDMSLYDQPQVVGGPYNLKGLERTDWIDGYKEGCRQGLGKWYRKPGGK